MKTADYHTVYFQPDPDREVVWQQICRYLQKFTPSSKRVLELGAGYCNFINNFPGKSKLAIDIWPGITRYAKPEVATQVLDLRRGLSGILGKYDVILASNFLEHLTLEETRRLLLDIRRHLAVQGRLIVIQPNFRLSYRRYFDDYTHKSIFTDISLTHLLKESGFDVVHLEPGFLPLTLRTSLPKWDWLVKLYLALPLRPFAGQMLVIADLKHV